MNRNRRFSRNKNVRRNRKTPKQSKRLRKRSLRNKRRNKRRTRNRQRGGYTTTSVSANTMSNNSNDITQAVNPDCNLRSNSDIFQSTFDTITNNLLPKIDDYSLINNNVYIRQ